MTWGSDDEEYWRRQQAAAIYGPILTLAAIGLLIWWALACAD